MMARLHSPAFPLLSDFAGGGGKRSEREQEVAIKAAFNAGYQQGIEEGRGEAEADCELRLAEARESFSAQSSEERLTWHRDCADLLTARFDAATKLIERSIEDRVASLLRPWLIERLRERALEDLGKAIGRALTDSAKVHIEAPPAIVAHLRERLLGEAFQVSYSESDSPDVRAHIGDTEIEANISAWIAELEAATS